MLRTHVHHARTVPLVPTKLPHVPTSRTRVAYAARLSRTQKALRPAPHRPIAEFSCARRSSTECPGRPIGAMCVWLAQAVRQGDIRLRHAHPTAIRSARTARLLRTASGWLPAMTPRLAASIFALTPSGSNGKDQARVTSVTAALSVLRGDTNGLRVGWG